MSIKDSKYSFAADQQSITVQRRVGYVRFTEVTAGGGTTPKLTVTGLGGGFSFTLTPGRAVTIPKGMEASGVVLTNISGNAMDATVAIAAEGWDVEDTSIAGTVNVVDSNFALTRAGQAFMPEFGYQSAAGQLPHIELANPAASGKTIEVQSFFMSASVATGVGIGIVSGAGNFLTGTPAVNIASKLASGGGASVSQIRTQDNAAVLLPGSRQPWAGFLVANGYIEKSFRAPIILMPGDTLRAFATTANIQITFGLETIERAVT